MDEYDGKQVVGIDLHRRRSVIVGQSESGEQLSAVRIINDPVALGLEIERAGPNPEVVLEATYGWYWAVDTLQAAGAHVHLAHPLGVKGFRYRRVKNDVRDAADLADLLRINRLPEAWIAPPATRELGELVRYRAKIVALRSGLKAQVHAVLAKAGVLIAVSDLFGVGGRQRLANVPLGAAHVQRVISLLELIDALDAHETRFSVMVADKLVGHAGYQAIQQLPGVGPHPGRGVGRRDRRRASVRRSRPVVFVGRADPAPPRVRHRGAPRAHHHTGLQAGAVGRRRSHRAPSHHVKDRAGPHPHRVTPRQEHRQDRRGTQTAHPGLLRAARRAHPRPGPPQSGVSTPDATPARPLHCLTPYPAWSPT